MTRNKLTNYTIECTSIRIKCYSCFENLKIIVLCKTVDMFISTDELFLLQNIKRNKVLEALYH